MWGTWETWTSTSTDNRWEMVTSHRVWTKAEKPSKATLERVEDGLEPGALWALRGVEP